MSWAKKLLDKPVLVVSHAGPELRGNTGTIIAIRKFAGTHEALVQFEFAARTEEHWIPFSGLKIIVRGAHPFAREAA